MTAGGFEVLADGLNHPEGVVWNPFDGLVYAGGEGGELYAVTLEGASEQIASTGGSMLGLAVDGAGRVYACDAELGQVARLDPRSGALETYARGPADTALDTPNVAAFGPDGSLYVTCSGENGRPGIVRVDPSGSVETWSTAVTGYPNGCLVTPNGEALVVVEAEAERLVRVRILPDGSAGEPLTVAELPGTDPDGVALDEDGGLWVTLYRPDGLVRVDGSGRVETIVNDRLAKTFDAPTNLAFAGENRDRAIVANVGGRFLLAGDLGVRGQPLHYPELP